MQLTRAADYAVRVMVHLATLAPGERATRDELAASGEVPEHFLSKILQTLTRGSLISSHRGASGGFALARAPKAITLLDVVEVMEGPLQLNACTGADVGCSRATKCSVHPVWVEAQEALTSVLRSARLDRLAREIEAGKPSKGGAKWS